MSRLAARAFCRGPRRHPGPPLAPRLVPRSPPVGDGGGGRTARRADRRQPLQPDRQPALAPAAGGNGPVLRGPRDSLDLRRDLPRTHLWGEPAANAVEYSTRAISINSFSKYYSMAGWRLGWMVMPEELVRPVERLAQNFFICPSSVAQAAALAAFEATYQSALGCAFGASALATASRSLTTRSFASSRSSGFAALLTSSRYISNS